jgi:hypothetical protein
MRPQDCAQHSKVASRSCAPSPVTMAWLCSFGVFPSSFEGTQGVQCVFQRFLFFAGPTAVEKFPTTGQNCLLGLGDPLRDNALVPFENGGSINPFLGLSNAPERTASNAWKSFTGGKNAGGELPPGDRPSGVARAGHVQRHRRKTCSKTGRASQDFLVKYPASARSEVFQKNDLPAGKTARSSR